MNIAGGSTHRMTLRRAFGKPFPKPKFDKVTGEERLRMRPNQELVKRVLSEKEHEQRSEAAKARWAESKHAASVGAAVAGGVALSYPVAGNVADAVRYIRGKPDPAKPIDIKTFATQWRRGEVAHLARMRSGIAGGEESMGAVLQGDRVLNRVDQLAAHGGTNRPDKLWRGMNGVGAAHFAKLKAGDVVSMDAPTSWTTDPSIGTHFTRFDFAKDDPARPVRMLAARLTPETFKRNGDVVTHSMGGSNVNAGADRVRVHLRGASKLHGIEIDKTLGDGGLQAETMMGRGTHIRVDKVGATKSGAKVIFATAMHQDPVAAYRRGVIRRVLNPHLQFGRMKSAGAAGLTLGLLTASALMPDQDAHKAAPSGHLAKAAAPAPAPAPPKPDVLAANPMLSRFARYRQYVAHNESMPVCSWIRICAGGTR